MTAHPCAEIRPLLHAFADGELAQGERGRVEEHLADCTTCSLEAARDRENAVFLGETLAPFRMPADFSTEFLAKAETAARGATGSKRAPRTVVMGAPPASASIPWKAVLAVIAVAAVGAAAFALFGRDRTPAPEPVAPREEVKPGEREEQGPADPKPQVKKPVRPRTGEVRERPPQAPKTLNVPLTGEELVAQMATLRGSSCGRLIGQGWGMLAGDPEQAKPIIEAAAKEQDIARRAALVLILGADEHNTHGEELRGYLLDDSPAVRISAILGLARSLSWSNPAKQVVKTGPPLDMGVDVGGVGDAGWIDRFAERMGSDGDDAVRRVLLQVLTPSAAEDARVRQTLLDGVRGAFGDDLRESCLAALRRAKNADVVGGLAEILGSPATSAAQVEAISLAMIDCDATESARHFENLLVSESDDARRRTLTAALVRCEVPGSFQTLRRLLSDDRESVIRAQAARGLAKDPTRETLALLLLAADNDADPDVQRHARRSASTVERLLQVEEQKNNPADRDGDRPADDDGTPPERQ